MNRTERTVDFVQMKDGTREDYQLLERYESEFIDSTSDRVLAHLQSLENSFDGYRVTRLGHALQCATRAWRDGAGEEMTVAALLHDIGDNLAPENHGELAAAVLRPYVSEKTYWILKHHGVFQGYYFFHHLGGDRNAREQFRDSIYFQDCADFCEKWDQCAFDPDYDTLPLEYFEPMVRRIFAREPFATHAN